MPTYIVTETITRATAERRYRVKARTAADALRKYREGIREHAGELIDDVIDVEEVTIDDVEEE